LRPATLLILTRSPEPCSIITCIAASVACKRPIISMSVLRDKRL
jgi:hypothetical protein